MFLGNWVGIVSTSLANLYPEEPDAGNPHVRICGGAGESNLPGPSTQNQSFPEPIAKLEKSRHPREGGGPEIHEKTGFPLPRE